MSGLSFSFFLCFSQEFLTLFFFRRGQCHLSSNLWVEEESSAGKKRKPKKKKPSFAAAKNHCRRQRDLDRTNHQEQYS
jgi:hypothetical protein